MKVPLSVRSLFDEQLELNRRLKEQADRKLESVVEQRWHYESRVKELQSFALKVETGRFRDPARLEDFFACSIVVANTLEVDRAEQRVKDTFRVHSRRPQQRDHTHKEASNFPFDDLRLYVSLGQDPSLPPNDLADVVFEVQIKTFLQHAWSIATHDLIYKSDAASWSKERIAYQVKAMLEHAEVSIEQAETLAKSTILKREDHTTSSIRKIVEVIKNYWDEGHLPDDVKRLATNTHTLLSQLKIKPRRLAKILDDERQACGGVLPSNLSPYSTIVQALFRQEKAKMTDLLTNTAMQMSVLIPSEIEFPNDLEPSTCCNAIFLGDRASIESS
jgi:ppGpp synthetase/RelA/SpoT-type nucleotidyltranferase